MKSRHHHTSHQRNRLEKRRLLEALKGVIHLAAIATPEARRRSFLGDIERLARAAIAQDEADLKLKT